MLDFHYEANGIAALAAAETLIDTLGRIYRKRRCLFRMERTKSPEIASLSLQENIAAYNGFDIRPGKYFINYIIRYKPHENLFL
jgi:hypothetical protein